jgi:hypothetical protein
MTLSVAKSSFLFGVTISLLTDNFALNLLAVFFFCVGLKETHLNFSECFEKKKMGRPNANELAIYFTSSIHLISAILYGLSRFFGIMTFVQIMTPIYMNLAPAYFVIDLCLLFHPIRQKWYNCVIFTVHHILALVIITTYRYKPTCVDLATTLLISEIPILFFYFQHWQRLTGKKWPTIRFLTSLVSFVSFFFFRLYRYSYVFYYVEWKKPKGQCILVHDWFVIWEILICLQVIFVVFLCLSFVKSIRVYFAYLFPPAPEKHSKE